MRKQFYVDVSYNDDGLPIYYVIDRETYTRAAAPYLNKRQAQLECARLNIKEME